VGVCPAWGCQYAEVAACIAYLGVLDGTLLILHLTACFLHGSSFVCSQRSAQLAIPSTGDSLRLQSQREPLWRTLISILHTVNCPLATRYTALHR
jgi:hypothetical protein